MECHLTLFISSCGKLGLREPMWNNILATAISPVSDPASLCLLPASMTGRQIICLPADPSQFLTHVFCEHVSLSHFLTTKCVSFSHLQPLAYQPTALEHLLMPWHEFSPPTTDRDNHPYHQFSRVHDIYTCIVSLLRKMKPSSLQRACYLQGENYVRPRSKSEKPCTCKMAQQKHNWQKNP